MTKKLSNTKVKRIIDLYLKGYNQPAIAKLIHVNQSTASQYVAKFKTIVEQEGMQTALAAFQIDEDPEETHTVVTEFQASGLTIGDVKIALQMANALELAGIKPAQYLTFVKICKKTKDAAYLSAAMKLEELEQTTGQPWKKALATAQEKYAQVEQYTQELTKLKGSVAAEKVKLSDIQKAKQKATDAFEKHKAQLGVDEARLTKVEALASALKTAGVEDAALPGYISRQQALTKAGLSVDMFEAILAQAKIQTPADGGKHLLKMLTEFGGLVKAVQTLAVSRQTLEGQVADLEEKEAILKTLNKEIAQLTNEKEKLKDVTTELEKKNKEFVEVAGMVAAANEQRQQLKTEASKKMQEIEKLEKKKTSLNEDVEFLEKKISDLKDQEAKRDAAQADWQALGKRREAFEGLLAFISATDLDKLKSSAYTLPKLIEEAVPGNYSVEFLQNFVIEDLAGPTLQTSKCGTCGARFHVDKPPLSGGFRCPRCKAEGLLHGPAQDKNSLSILKSAVAQDVPGGFTVKLISGPKKGKKGDG